jgi:DNA-binding MarR family transcriptional regulator
MDEATGLEAMLCFELYTASRAMTGLYRPALEAAGITYPQYVALRVIWQRGSVKVTDLGATLHLDSGTLSPLLKRLEAQNLVHRTRGEDDKRTVWVSATPEGMLLEQQLADLPERLACTLDLSVEDFTTLYHLLGRVRGTATASNL